MLLSVCNFSNAPKKKRERLKGGWWLRHQKKRPPLSYSASLPPPFPHTARETLTRNSNAGEWPSSRIVGCLLSFVAQGVPDGCRWRRFPSTGGCISVAVHGVGSVRGRRLGIGGGGTVTGRTLSAGRSIAWRIRCQNGHVWCVASRLRSGRMLLSVAHGVVTAGNGSSEASAG
jgi:hypothetical protein